MVHPLVSLSRQPRISRVFWFGTTSYLPFSQTARVEVSIMVPPWFCFRLGGSTGSTAHFNAPPLMLRNALFCEMLIWRSETWKQKWACKNLRDTNGDWAGRCGNKLEAVAALCVGASSPKGSPKADEGCRAGTTIAYLLLAPPFRFTRKATLRARFGVRTLLFRNLSANSEMGVLARSPFLLQGKETSFLDSCFLRKVDIHQPPVPNQPKTPHLKTGVLRARPLARRA